MDFVMVVCLQKQMGLSQMDSQFWEFEFLRRNEILRRWIPFGQEDVAQDRLGLLTVTKDTPAT